MRFGVTLVSVAALAAVAALGSRPAPASAAPSLRAPFTASNPAPTDLRILTPLISTGALAAGYSVAQHYSAASCVSGSPTTGSTYECSTPQSSFGVYEACWVTGRASFVDCLTKPWSRTVTQLHVTRGYDDTDGFVHYARPWGVMLDSGQRCLLDIDATSTSDGHANMYFCDHKTVLVDSVDRTHAVWRARAYRQLPPKNHHARVRYLGWLPIAIAWRTKESTADSLPMPVAS